MKTNFTEGARGDRGLLDRRELTLVDFMSTAFHHHGGYLSLRREGRRSLAIVLCRGTTSK